MPGVVFTAQATWSPLREVAMDLILVSDEPTRKLLPGLATVKAPPLMLQLSAVEPLKIIMSAVVLPKVTPVTVKLASAVKSVVAAKRAAGLNIASQAVISVAEAIFIYILYIPLKLRSN